MLLDNGHDRAFAAALDPPEFGLGDGNCPRAFETIGEEMSERDLYSNLPAENPRGDLEDLEPHQQTIERVAEVYFGTCERVARAIRAIKSRLGTSDD